MAAKYSRLAFSCAFFFSFSSGFSSWTISINYKTVVYALLCYVLCGTSGLGVPFPPFLGEGLRDFFPLFFLSFFFASAFSFSFWASYKANGIILPRNRLCLAPTRSRSRSLSASSSASLNACSAAIWSMNALFIQWRFALLNNYCTCKKSQSHASNTMLYYSKLLLSRN